TLGCSSVRGASPLRLRRRPPVLLAVPPPFGLAVSAMLVPFYVRDRSRGGRNRPSGSAARGPLWDVDQGAERGAGLNGSALGGWCEVVVRAVCTARFPARPGPCLGSVRRRRKPVRRTAGRVPAMLYRAHSTD